MLVQNLIQDYENLGWFLQEDGVGKMFDDLLGDVHADLKKQIDKAGENGFKMNGTLLKEPGSGILSHSRESDEPASVLVQRHRPDVPEVTISKPTMWDEITLNGEKYARECTRELYLQGDSKGLTHFVLSFRVRATRASMVEIAKRAGSFEYWLGSRYELSSPYSEELEDSGSTILFHYDPMNEVEHEFEGRKYTGPEILSRDVFHSGNFTLSEDAKRRLLQIMDMVTIYGINQPSNTVYKDLLQRQQLRLRKPS